VHNATFQIVINELGSLPFCASMTFKVISVLMHILDGAPAMPDVFFH